MSDPRAYVISQIDFMDNLNLMKTDTLEFDYKRNRVSVVSSAGKVKQNTTFRFREAHLNGKATGTGQGQD